MEKEKIPILQVINKLDAYLNKEDYPNAERLLRYWWEESKRLEDSKGELSILNEILGFSRRINDAEWGMAAVFRSFQLIEELNLDSRTSGTVYLNGATTLKAFGKADRAVVYYQKANDHLSSALEQNDPLLAGLYNNYALALVDLKRYDDAIDLYQNAIEIMTHKDQGELEIAITLMNIAELWESMGENTALIEQTLEQALKLLNDKKLKRNGYYAFVCRKCAPTFGHFGWFAAKMELNERADRIYEGN